MAAEVASHVQEYFKEKQKNTSDPHAIKIQNASTTCSENRTGSKAQICCLVCKPAGARLLVQLHQYNWMSSRHSTWCQHMPLLVLPFKSFLTRDARGWVWDHLHLHCCCVSDLPKLVLKADFSTELTPSLQTDQLCSQRITWILNSSEHL